MVISMRWIIAVTTTALSLLLAAAAAAITASSNEGNRPMIVAKNLEQGADTSASTVQSTVPDLVLLLVEKDNNDDDGSSKRYREAKILLDSLGLRHACHPTRSDLRDWFPRCEEEHDVIMVAAAPSSSDHHHHHSESTLRKLVGEEDEENEEEQNEENYVAEDEIFEQEAIEEEEEVESGWSFNLADVIIATLCVMSSSMAAGLTVGLLSLDPLVLMIKARAGDVQEARQAQALLPLVRQRHLLLVTLMLVNTASSESLPVVLHDMMPEFFVVIVSVALILFFGEILPSAVFIGHNQLAIASALSPLVHVIMWLVYPIAYPIAKLLDCVVPHDGCAMNYYTRNELAALIRLQYEARMAERQAKERRRQAMTMTKKANVASSPMACFVRSGSSDDDNKNQLLSSASNGNSIHTTVSLDLDEVIMAEGALALRSRKVADLVISRKKVFSISYDAELTEEMIVHIFSSGYSRVPVYRGQNPKQICGILMTRELILVKATDRKKVGDLPLHTARCIGPDMDLVALVNLFQTGGGGVGVMGRTRRSAGHMAIVCAQPDLANDVLHQADDGVDDQPIPAEAGLIGIITMEDVLEALLQEQIYDEMDAAGRRSSIRGTDSTSVSTAGTSGAARRNKNNNGTAAAARNQPQHPASSSMRHPLPPPSTTPSAADATSDYSALL